MKPKSETANLSETYDFPALNMNSAYVDYQASLARFNRASLVARGYQQYRITKLVYRFKPKLDTFAVNATQAGAIATIPYLYVMIDKTGNMADFTTSDQLRSAGAKPRRLDDKTLIVAYKPAVLQYTLDRNNNTNTWAKPTVSPWLSTDKFNDVQAGTPWAASSIDHLGLAWFVEETGAGVTNQYDLEVTAHFEFKKPAISPGLALGATPAVQVGLEQGEPEGKTVTA